MSLEAKKSYDAPISRAPSPVLNQKGNLDYIHSDTLTFLSSGFPFLACHSLDSRAPQENHHWLWRKYPTNFMSHVDEYGLPQTEEVDLGHESGEMPPKDPTSPHASADTT